MFVFGHVGLTLAGAVLVHGLLSHQSPIAISDNVAQTAPANSPAKSFFSGFTWFASLGRYIDLRILIVGAMFPDIIDKPLGILGFGNGRSITHTLLITFIVLFIGIILHKRIPMTAVLALAIGMASHLVLDEMWMTQRTFFWPLWGWTFPSEGTRGWLDNWLVELTGNWQIIISEISGLAIIIFFVMVLISRKRLFSFLNRGQC